MFKKNNTYKTSIVNYIETIFKILLSPSKTFKYLDLSFYQLVSYLILSALFYAVIACLLRNLAPFLLIILSPISIIPHAFLIALSLYLIFIKLFHAEGSFEKCFKLSSYVLIALLPLMAIVFIKSHDTPVLLLIKALPFIYFLLLVYTASYTGFENLRFHKLIQGNVLSSLIILFVSTMVFTINIMILSFLSEVIFHYTYVWKIYYD